MSAAETPAAPAAPKKKSRLLLVLLLVLVLGGAGGGGWYAYTRYFAPPPPAQGQAGAAPQAASSAPPAYHEMETFLVNLADAGGKRYLKVTMKLEVRPAPAVKDIADRSFEVRDAVIQILTAKEYQDVASPQGKAGLKQEITARINRIVKTAQVRDIFFTDFLIQ